VQNTPGAALVPELEVGKIDRIVEKGMDSRVEMYSAFYDPLKEPRVSDSGLAKVLKEEGVTHVYVVGLAADYCVKFTAVDAAGEGFETYIVDEATRAVDQDEWETAKKELARQGVEVVGMDGKEVKRVVEHKPSG
jgi:nicotinamidase-related amidase